MLVKLIDLFSFLSVVLRAGTLVFQSVLLGGVLFVLWVARRSPDASDESIDRVQASSWKLLRLSAVGLAIVQLLYLYVDSAVLMASADIGFQAVVGANFFISGSIVLVAALLTAIVTSGSKSIARWALPVLTVVIMVASVMTNHAASRLTGRPLLITLSSIHELATGFWIGGLPFLILGLFRAQDSTTRWYLTERFSRMALVAVGFLVVSGIALSYLYINSWGAVLGSAYGVMVSAKALMLGVLLLLGGVNFLLLRDAPKDQVMPRLRRLIEAELGIGITVILTAASLTSQPPAVDQPEETVSMHQIWHRIKPAAPRLNYHFIPETDSATGETAQARPGNASQCGRGAADAAAHQQLDRVGVEPSLDGPGGAGHGTTGAAGANRKSSVGGILAAAADRHRSLHLSCWPTQNVGPSGGRASGPAGPTLKSSSIAWRRWSAWASRCLSCACASKRKKTIRGRWSSP